MKTAKEYLLDQLKEFPDNDEYDQKILGLLAYWMEEYAKYHHEQQVKSVDLHCHVQYDLNKRIWNN